MLILPITFRTGAEGGGGGGGRLSSSSLSSLSSIPTNTVAAHLSVDLKQEVQNVILTTIETVTTHHDIVANSFPTLTNNMVPALLLVLIYENSADIRFLTVKTLTEIVVFVFDTARRVIGQHIVMMSANSHSISPVPSAAQQQHSQGGAGNINTPPVPPLPYTQNELDNVSEVLVGLLSESLFPVLKKLLTDESPIPLYILKLLSPLIRTHPRLLVPLQDKYFLLHSVMSFFSPEDLANNIHNTQIIRFFVASNETNKQLLFDLDIVRRLIVVFESVVKMKISEFCDPLIEITYSLLYLLLSTGNTKESSTNNKTGSNISGGGVTTVQQQVLSKDYLISHLNPLLQISGVLMRVMIGELFPCFDDSSNASITTTSVNNANHSPSMSPLQTTFAGGGGRGGDRSDDPLSIDPQVSEIAAACIGLMARFLLTPPVLPPTPAAFSSSVNNLLTTSPSSVFMSQRFRTLIVLYVEESGKLFNKQHEKIGSGSGGSSSSSSQSVRNTGGGGGGEDVDKPNVIALRRLIKSLVCLTAPVAQSSTTLGTSPNNFIPFNLFTTAELTKLKNACNIISKDKQLGALASKLADFIQ
jgi:hypothetical protein